MQALQSAPGEKSLPHGGRWRRRKAVTEGACSTSPKALTQKAERSRVSGKSSGGLCPVETYSSAARLLPQSALTGSQLPPGGSLVPALQSAPQIKSVPPRRHTIIIHYSLFILHSIVVHEPVPKAPSKGAFFFSPPVV